MKTSEGRTCQGSRVAVATAASMIEEVMGMVGALTWGGRGGWGRAEEMRGRRKGGRGEGRR